MKVRSALLTEMAGKLGNAVAATARGGVTYFRALVTPRNPLSHLQLLVRQALISATTYWRSILSESDQEAWWDNATGSQTGQTLFVRVNQPRVYAASNPDLQVNGSIADDAIYITTPPESNTTQLTEPNSIAIDDSANTMSIIGINAGDPWASEDIAAGQASLLYVYASHEQSASRFSRQHPYRLVRVIVRAADADPWDAGDPLTFNLGDLGFTTQAGKVMYVKMVAQDKSGGISQRLEQRVTITL